MQVIFNADDFGRSASINGAVIQAHLQGVLTSASLMVNGEAVQEAVALAQQTPTLAIGLHLVVAGGIPALPPECIPHLVDGKGNLSSDAFWLGWNIFISRITQAELKQEMEAQFARFSKTGLPMAHVDGHLHMHIHPTVFKFLLPLAVQYNARGIRIPRDDFWFAMRYDKQQASLRALWAIIFSLLCHGHQIKARQAGLAFTQRVYGLMRTGRMDTGYVTALLSQLQVPTAELYFHPSIMDEGEPMGPNPGDLATLLDPEVKRVIHQRNISLATYLSLQS